MPRTIDLGLGLTSNAIHQGAEVVGDDVVVRETSWVPPQAGYYDPIIIGVWSGGPTALQFGDPFGTGTTWGCAVRFNGIAIPQGSTIDDATLSFTVKTVTGTPGTTTLAAENADDATSLTGVQDPTALTYTVGQAVSYASTIPVSEDVQADIQTIVNRVGWASGNDINFVWITGTWATSALCILNSALGGNEVTLTVNYT